MSNTIIISHNGCSDGFCGLYVCHKKYPDAELYPAIHNTDPPDVDGKDVIIVDFSYSKEILFDIKKRANSLLLLDHHLTSRIELGIVSDPDIKDGECVFENTRIPVNSIGGLIRSGFIGMVKVEYPTLTNEQLAIAEMCVFYQEKSGAGIAWDFFFPNEPRPWFIDYVEAKDLWKLNSLPNVREVDCYMRSFPLNIESFYSFENKSIYEAVFLGKEILRYQEQLVAALLKTAQEVEIEGYKVLMVNTGAQLQSEVAGALAKNRPFGVAYFDNENGERKYSLRSTKDGVDVEAVAKNWGAKYGIKSGGHKQSAAVKLPKGAYV